MAELRTTAEAQGNAGIVRGAIGFVVYWMPVWIPLTVLGQVALLGLRPALNESRRLEHEEAIVTERFERSRSEFERMQAEATAWKDPVYRERLRRARIEGAERPQIEPEAH